MRSFWTKIWVAKSQEDLIRDWALGDGTSTRGWGHGYNCWWGSDSKSPTCLNAWLRGWAVVEIKNLLYFLPLCPLLSVRSIKLRPRLVSRKCPFVISSWSFCFQSYVDISDPFPVDLCTHTVLVTIALLSPHANNSGGEEFILGLSFRGILDIWGEYFCLLCWSGRQRGSYGSPPVSKEHRAESSLSLATYVSKKLILTFIRSTIS